jgi:integrase
LGIETGLRISDILRVKIKDIENPLRVYVSRSDVVAAHQLSAWLYGQLLDYTSKRNPDDYIFPGERSHRRHLHRVTYHRDLKRAGNELRLDFSAHSTRKLYLFHCEKM